jgi:ribosomal protein L11 methyltransferase
MVIEIDPARAFGTGLHESTRLVLDFIEELYPPGAAGPQRVLDVGTGTGILAMACALLGAGHVLAIDNDPLAVAAARENVASNGLEGRVAVSGEDLAAVEGAWDLVTANIVHDALVALAADLAGRLAVGGSLVCAGILAGGQEKSLATAFAGYGLAVTATKRDGEWAALQVKLFS